MNTELKDFIYEISEFNDCNFCRKFGFNKTCPITNAYNGLKEEPSSDFIEKNANLCKDHVFTSLTSLFSK